MSFPDTPLIIRLRIAPGVTDFSANPSTYPWQDITTYLDMTSPIVDSIGAADDVAETNTELTFSLRNNDGRFTTDDPESPYYPYFDVGCPIEYSLDAGGGLITQVIAYLGVAVNRWPAGTPYRCVADVTAGGQFRRLGLQPPIASALRRTIPSLARRKAYWPLEDATGATAAASAVPAVASLTAGGASNGAPDFGAAALVPGTASMMTLKTGTRLAAALPSPTTALGVRVSMLLFANTVPVGNPALFELRATGGTVARFGLEIGTNSLRVRAWSPGGVEQSGALFIGFTAHQEACVWFEYDMVQSSAGTISWTMRETTWTVNAAGGPTGTTGVGSGSFAGTLGRITAVEINPFQDVDDVTIGHFALTEQPFPTSGGLAAVLGWTGNTAAGRVQGMGAEFRVPTSVTSSLLGEVMGPQIVGSLLDNLRNCQSTDHGILTDHLGVIGYRALSELYNLAPSITLLRATRGELPRAPAQRDDQQKANIAGAQRPQGSSFTATDATDVQRYGPYEREPISVNVALDSQLPGHAGWALARGSARGYRFPEVTLQLHLAPHLATSVLNLKLGDRIALQQPPQAAPDTLVRQVRGRRQTVYAERKWEVTYSLVPVDPYEAFILDTDRLDTSGSELLTAATSTATTAVVATAGALPDSSVVPVDLDLMGERVTLTAVATETLTDAFTRVVAGGSWGSLPAGANVPAQAWALAASGSATTADASVNGTQGLHSLPSSGAILRSTLPLQMANPEILMTVTTTTVPTGGSLAAGLGYRWNGTNAYSARLLLDAGGGVRLVLYSPALVVLADVTLPYTHASGQVYNLLIAPVNSLHKIKVWVGTEPSDWTVLIEDTERLTAGSANSIQIRSSRENTNAGASVLAYDNFTIRNAQAWTLTRSVNGVVKAQGVGASAKLWRGKGLGV